MPTPFREDLVSRKSKFLTVFRKALLPLAIWMLAACSLPAAKPNVVVILADDLGYGDIEAFGGKLCNVDTPHFDRLCAEGMMFTNAHVTDSVCVPSRKSILTGRYAFRFGKPASAGGKWGFCGLEFAQTQHTLGDVFQAGGYVTGYVGKWHLGTEMSTKDGKTQGSDNTDFTQPIRTGPTDYGFHQSFFLPGSLDMPPYAFIRGKNWQGDVTARKGCSAFNRLGPAAEDFLYTNVLPTLCHEAGNFIKEQADAKKPFFLFVGLTSPHTPTSPEPAFEGKSRIGIYGDFVMNTDACIGRIREQLQAAGVDKNTLLIVSSDHGPGHYSGRQRKAIPGQMLEMHKDGHHPNGPFRGYKFSALEGGLRVPTAAVWPGVIQSKSKSDALIGLNDLMATLADVAEVKLTDHQAPDSISFLKVMKDPTAQSRRTLIARGTHANAFYLDDWKLILGPGSGSSGILGSEPTHELAWKKAVQEYGRKPSSQNELTDPTFIQLYNLRDDPSESKNLSRSHPEKAKEMLGLYLKEIQHGSSTPGPELKNDHKVEAFNTPSFAKP